MKQSLILFCLCLAVSAVRHKGTTTTLEDIELDYTTLHKRTKLSPPPPPRKPAQSPTHFGFVPTKTAADYAQQEPRPNYSAKYQVGGASQAHQDQQVGIQYLPVGFNPYDVSVPVPQVGATQYQVGVTSQQMGTASKEGESQRYVSTADAAQQHYNTIQYSGPTYTKAGRDTVVPQVYYVPQAQGQYDNYENLHYVTDNNIGQAGQQYVYLQQYQAPSTDVQTVADPTHGGVQYVMYLPAYNPTANQPQKYENIYSVSSSERPSYQTIYKKPQFTQKQEPTTSGKTQYTKANYIHKREPKSLLDSYVPSHIQLQYYKAQENAIQNENGKTGSKFSYIPNYTS